jgi:4-alpha-glucanotransferase
MAEEGYRWWIDRLRTTLELVDVVRIDHFRGLAAYWEIPAANPTAEHGRWVSGPGSDLFRALRDALGDIPIIVEDLGVITPDVVELRESLGYPGMKVLQFAFDSGPTNPFLPHNFDRNVVVYTGTHDNDTSRGWFESCSAREQEDVRRYLNVDGQDIAWDLIRLALSSVADVAIYPVQDVLTLGSEGRMNYPGRVGGNWNWRLGPGQLSDAYGARLADLTTLFGRNASTRN